MSNHINTGNNNKTFGSSTGKLHLTFALDPHGTTCINKQYSSYPFHICRPFYLDDEEAKGMATIYTQSCSGGLYSKDHLQTVIEATPGAQAQLTTQASTIVHRSKQTPASQAVFIRAGDRALVEYLPDPAILFPGSYLKSEVRVKISPTASIALCDSFMAHDYDGTGGVFERMESLIYLSDWNGKPLVIDRINLTGHDFISGTVGIMGSFACHGSFITIAPSVNISSLREAYRASFSNNESIMAGVSELPNGNGLSARILAKDAVEMKKAMNSLTILSRKFVVGSEPGRRPK